MTAVLFCWPAVASGAGQVGRHIPLRGDAALWFQTLHPVLPAGAGSTTQRPNLDECGLRAGVADGGLEDFVKIASGERFPY